MQGDGWNPYLAGGLLGLLAVVSAYLTTLVLGGTNYLGASTTFVRLAGLLRQVVDPDRVLGSEYFAGVGLRVNWQFMLVLGIFIGALISALRDKSFRLESVPPIWKERFGRSIFKRAAGAFLGGIVAMVGARLASGCPSGHGLSGMMQLSVSAFVALIMFVGTGVPVAMLIYRRKTSS